MRESCRIMARRRFDSPTLSPPSRAGPDFAIESAWIEGGARFVAGVDEVGRGPLAGPVVAAAVVLNPAMTPPGLDDSKKLSALERERLFAEIVATATAVSLASASSDEIDRVNIRQATLLAMQRAVAGLPIDPCRCLIDGIDVPPTLISCATAVVSGDARSLSIAAASIVAKVMRDRMMTRLCASFPAYGFSRHMGYGTKEHLAAIEKQGACRHHRQSFSPFRRKGADG